jgi:hypothetical protein
MLEFPEAIALFLAYITGDLSFVDMVLEHAFGDFATDPARSSPLQPGDPQCEPPGFKV